MSSSATRGPRPDHQPPWVGPAEVQCERSESGRDAGGALDLDRPDPNLHERGEAPATTPTFGSALPTVLAARALSVSPATAARSEGIANRYLLPRWGDATFDEIDRQEVLTWLADLTGSDVAATTQVKILALFRAVWAEAKRGGGTSRSDPSDGLSIRKPPAPMGRALTGDELARLIGAAAGDWSFRAQLLLAGVLGLRWGEIAALSMGDVDLDGGLVHVRGTLARGRGRYELKRPKTSASARALPIPAALSADLRRTVTGRSSGAVFVAKQGGRLNYHSSRRSLIRVALRAGVPDCQGWHVLRRTAATLALQGGMTLKDVSVMLGHSTPSVTLTRYVAARDAHGLATPLTALTNSALGRPAGSA